MFGYVTASFQELTQPQQQRYTSLYCGICRRIRMQSGNAARLGLQYDMVFLSALLMSLYEPEEQQGDLRCLMHPVKRRPWVDSEFIRYAADMNVALSYYKSLDDWQDDRKLSAAVLSRMFGAHFPQIQAAYPRQCAAIRDRIAALSALEQENCPNPDTVAGVFGELMGELFVWKEDDYWASALRQMGNALGRFIYLLDAAMDYDSDAKAGKYNPYLAMGQEKDPARWEEYLVLTMGRCTQLYEMLPLVQDKALLDNILYSGVWITYRGKRKEGDHHD